MGLNKHLISLSGNKKVTTLSFWVHCSYKIIKLLTYIRIWVKLRMAPVAFLLTRRSVDRISRSRGLMALQDTMECLFTSEKKVIEQMHMKTRMTLISLY